MPAPSGCSPYRWATGGPYRGGTVTWRETYKDWNIWWLSGPIVYGLTDPSCVEKATAGTSAALRKYVDDHIEEQGEGQASIIEVNLPTELDANDLIIGYFRVKNIGTAESDINILVTTMWDGAQYSGHNIVPVGSILRTAIIDTHNVRMPNQNAEIMIEAQHLENGVWVTDDTRTH